MKGGSKYRTRRSHHDKEIQDNKKRVSGHYHTMDSFNVNDRQQLNKIVTAQDRSIKTHHKLFRELEEKKDGRVRASHNNV